jgi:xylulokinase
MKAIGIDIGTSGTKGVLVRFPQGKVLKSVRKAYRLYAEGNRAEHEPEDWVKAVQAVLKALGPADAIGMDGMMHSEVCLNGADLKANGRAILWCDGRSEAECAEILSRCGLDLLRATVGNKPFAGFTLPHLLWRRKNGKPLGEAVALCKDYVRFRLTGELRHEISDASGMVAWHLSENRWASEVLEKVGIDPGLFPKPCGSTEVVGKWKGIPVVGGASDNGAAAVGLGVVRPGQASASMGTSNVLIAVHDRPVVDPDMAVHTFAHPVPGRFMQLGCMLTGTRSYDWILKAVGKTVRNAPVAQDSRGLLFAPYLVGERTPYADTAVRGMFAGLSPDHDASHFVRAVMEGTAFALRDAQEIMKAKSVRVTGGGMKSPVWRQIIADVLGIPVVTVSTSEEGAAYGSAILAGVGVGAFKSVEEATDRLVRETSVTRPQRSYDAAYARYRKLYPAAKSLA